CRRRRCRRLPAGPGRRTPEAAPIARSSLARRPVPRAATSPGKVPTSCVSSCSPRKILETVLENVAVHRPALEFIVADGGREPAGEAEAAGRGGAQTRRKLPTAATPPPPAQCGEA